MLLNTHKECIKCGGIKLLTEFYKQPGNKDNRGGRCKTCVKKASNDRRLIKMKDPEWAFNEAERHRLKSKKQVASGYKSPNKHVSNPVPYKKKATTAANRIHCPSDHHRHHWSYNKEHWKDIFIVTVKFHNKIHRYTKYDPDMKMYRTVHGTLLDSRELAQKYYDKIAVIIGGEYSELTKLF